MGDAVALDVVDPAGGSIEQQIDQMGSRLTSSTYKTPPSARASRPGERLARGPRRGPRPDPGCQRCASSLAPSGRVTKRPPSSRSARLRARVDLADTARALDQHADGRIDGRQAQRQLPANRRRPRRRGGSDVRSWLWPVDKHGSDGSPDKIRMAVRQLAIAADQRDSSPLPFMGEGPGRGFIQRHRVT